jgi:hypothetical protein
MMLVVVVVVVVVVAAAAAATRYGLDVTVVDFLHPSIGPCDLPSLLYSLYPVSFRG